MRACRQHLVHGKTTEANSKTEKKTENVEGIFFLKINVLRCFLGFFNALIFVKTKQNRVRVRARTNLVLTLTRRTVTQTLALTVQSNRLGHFRR